MQRLVRAGTLQAFLVLSHSNNEDERQRWPIDGWRAIGVATAQPYTAEDTPEQLHTDNISGSVEYAYWLRGSDRANARINGFVTKTLVAETTYPETVRPWSVTLPGDSAKSNALGAIGLRAVGPPQQYDLGDGCDARRQLLAAPDTDASQ